MNQFNPEIFGYSSSVKLPMFQTHFSPSRQQMPLFSGLSQNNICNLPVPSRVNNFNSSLYFKQKNYNEMVLQRLLPLLMLQRRQPEPIKPLYQSHLNYQALFEASAKLSQYQGQVLNSNTKQEEEIINNSSPVSKLAEETDVSCVKQEELQQADETLVVEQALEIELKKAYVPKKNTKSKKIKKKRNSCGHPDKKHYAKGMCNNCYHKYGRFAKPTGCDHDLLYAKGLCQKCYVTKYNKQKADKVKGSF
jgi:hypothetical protein